jgi:hypothetical protein
MWRTRSCQGSGDTDCLPVHVVAESRAEGAAEDEIDPGVQQLLDLQLEPGEGEERGSGVGIELDEDVDVAVLAGLAAGKPKMARERTPCSRRSSGRAARRVAMASSRRVFIDGATFRRPRSGAEEAYSAVTAARRLASLHRQVFGGSGPKSARCARRATELGCGNIVWDTSARVALVRAWSAADRRLRLALDFAQVLGEAAHVVSEPV